MANRIRNRINYTFYMHIYSILNVIKIYVKGIKIYYLLFIPSNVEYVSCALRITAASAPL